MNRNQQHRLTALIEALEAERAALSWTEERLLGELQEVRRAYSDDAVQSYLAATYGQQTPSSVSHADTVQSGQDATQHYIKAMYGR